MPFTDDDDDDEDMDEYGYAHSPWAEIQREEFDVTGKGGITFQFEAEGDHDGIQTTSRRGLWDLFQVRILIRLFICSCNQNTPPI